MKARLQSNLNFSGSIDRANRVVSGVKVLENNREVTYRGADGKAISFRTSTALLTKLIEHAGNRTIPSHLTHDHLDGKSDALRDRIGGIRNCRLSDDGHLIADFYAMPNSGGESILWMAENDPANAMLSAVFDYNPIPADGVTYAYPLTFDAADFVTRGAGVTAMLSAARKMIFLPDGMTQIVDDIDMTKEEVSALLNELIPGAVKAALADYKPAGYITEKEADAKLTAALAAIPKPPEKLCAADIEKITDEATVKAEAKLVARLGSGPLITSVSGNGNAANDPFLAKVALNEQAGCDKKTATLRAAHDNPDEYERHMKARGIFR